MKKWLWDRRKRVYVDTQGHTLPKRELTKGLDDYIESVQGDMSAKVKEFTTGAITAAVLFHLLDEEITALHGASGAIAYGGLEEMDDLKWARIDERLMNELGFLHQFKMDVHEAELTGEPLSVEGIANRAGLYAEAAYSEFVAQEVKREGDEGVTMGRRICEADGASCEECVDAATEEFIPLDDIPDIGSLQCISNCRCEIEFDVSGVQFSTSELFSGVVGGQDAFGGDVTVQ